MFRFTADIQSRRRVGLTATLVREDGRESDVFSLIGPKRFDAPWRDIEAQGYIAPADCCEIRVSLPESDRMVYALAEPEDRYRLAAASPEKTVVVRRLIAQHADDQVLVIGQYRPTGRPLPPTSTPLITGKTPVRERQRLFDEFRSGELRVLVVSKVANFSIDLPQARVAIQVSGRSARVAGGGSGSDGYCVPRPTGPLRTSTVVTRDTVDADFRGPPAAVPGGAGIRLSDHGRRGSVSPQRLQPIWGGHGLMLCAEWGTQRSRFDYDVGRWLGMMIEKIESRTAGGPITRLGRDERDSRPPGPSRS